MSSGVAESRKQAAGSMRAKSPHAQVEDDGSLKELCTEPGESGATAALLSDKSEQSDCVLLFRGSPLFTHLRSRIPTMTDGFRSVLHLLFSNLPIWKCRRTAARHFRFLGFLARSFYGASDRA